MIRKKFLLLFEQIDTFEQFVASNITIDSVEVSTPYKQVVNSCMHNIRAILKRIPGYFFYKYWLED